MLSGRISPSSAVDASFVVNQKRALLQCFKECYGVVDDKIVTFLSDKFSPLFESPSGSKIIDDFIKESKKLNLDFTTYRPPAELAEDDAVRASPDQHEIVFESEYVRILYSATKPGEVEPLHRHPWKRIIVAMKEAEFKVTDGNTGAVEYQKYERGVYICEANEYYTCENIGSGPEECLGFEIKT